MHERSLEERIELFRNMAASDPTNDLAHFSLGKLYVERGDLSDAEESLRRVLELSPEHTQAHRWLADALLGLGKKDEAVEVLRNGMLLAHRRGEYMPRNQMREMLLAHGVEPPPVEAEDAASAGDDTQWRCSRCLRAQPQLPAPPFSSELGERIHEHICQSCWNEWVGMSIKVINEFRLNLATKEGSKVFDEHMVEFLGL